MAKEATKSKNQARRQNDTSQQSTKKNLRAHMEARNKLMKSSILLSFFLLFSYFSCTKASQQIAVLVSRQKLVVTDYFHIVEEG